MPRQPLLTLTLAYPRTDQTQWLPSQTRVCRFVSADNCHDSPLVYAGSRLTRIRTHVLVLVLVLAIFIHMFPIPNTDLSALGLASIGPSRLCFARPLTPHATPAVHMASLTILTVAQSSSTCFCLHQVEEYLVIHTTNHHAPDCNNTAARGWIHITFRILQPFTYPSHGTYAT